VKLRLFVAVELDDATRTFASRTVERLIALGVDGRYEPIDKLHVTVAFLGAVDSSDLDAVIEALRDTTTMCSPFELRFERIGVFPSMRRPRVLWIGPAQESASFLACAIAVRTAYERIGFSFDHDPVAHITICRPRVVPDGALGALHTGVTQAVNGLTLMRSLPAGPTTRYEALERTSFSIGGHT
jgi:2'-5' RNA ligase